VSSGTQRVADINPGPASSDPQYLTATPAGVFFSADDGTHGRELWFATPDGASAQLVEDLSLGVAATRIDTMAAFGGDVIFGCEITNSAQQGSGLCRANTAGVQVLSQGEASTGELAEPSEGLAPFGGRLIYTPLNAADDYATASFGAPLPIAVLADDGTMTGALDPSSISITSQPTSGTASVDPASGLVTYTGNRASAAAPTASYAATNYATARDAAAFQHADEPDVFE
jgi:ELWxxDGT repeat protein